MILSIQGAQVPCALYLFGGYIVKKLLQLPAVLLALVLSLGSIVVATAQEATPEATAGDIGSPVSALECWSDEPDSSTAGYPQYPGVPEMKIDTTKGYYATIVTNRGNIVVQLYADVAPVTVNNFVCLATNDYFDGVIFHRVIRDFMIQTGDPTGTGRGGPGYQFNDELPGNPDERVNYMEGSVAMANSGPNTNGSQFFINTTDNAGKLPSSYTLFGQVVEGQDVVQLISEVPVAMNAQGEMSVPAATITILDISITEK